jgi:TRAP transporter TAXI family solute receptor
MKFEVDATPVVSAARSNWKQWAVGAAIAVAVIGVAAAAFGQTSKAGMNFCTGGASGNYYWVGKQLEANTKGSISVNVVETRGSMDNLDKIVTAECDGAIVQNDALRVFQSRNPRSLGNIERVTSLYREYVHLVCNRQSGIDRVTDLTNRHTVAIGPAGSGSSVTWEGFVLADKKKYGPVNTSPLAGLRALAAVKDGSQVQCMLFTAGLNSQFVKEDIQAAGDRVVLVKADDRDFDNAVDDKGRKIYTFADIPGGLYRKIQPSGLTCIGSCAVPTVAVDAVAIMRTEWIDRNERVYDGAFLRTLQALDGQIKQRVGN